MKRLLHNAAFLAFLNGTLLFLLIHTRCISHFDRAIFRASLVFYAAFYVYQLKKLLTKKNRKAHHWV